MGLLAKLVGMGLVLVSAGPVEKELYAELVELSVIAKSCGELSSIVTDGRKYNVYYLDLQSKGLSFQYQDQSPGDGCSDGIIGAGDDIQIFENRKNVGYVILLGADQLILYKGSGAGKRPEMDREYSESLRNYIRIIKENFQCKLSIS